ncbi:MAG TPA: hypothetical protein DCZ48_14500 [Methylococcaceae bacterium]|nr:hypothetical protein [Methylococcaceae bacterium]
MYLWTYAYVKNVFLIIIKIWRQIMFQIKTEGFNPNEAATITALTREVAALAARATSGFPELRTRYFGTSANSRELQQNLDAMDNYLNKKCVLITFVRKNVGHRVDSVPVEVGDYGQVIPNVGRTTANFKTTEWHVSGGLRVYTMNEYFDAVNTNDREEMVNYIYHEITHKVLDTIDYKYGKEKCKAFAIKNPLLAIKNADSYGYFIADIDASTP